MSEELEVLGAAAIGAVAKDTTGDGYLNGPCPNCGTEITGHFCSHCGQSAKDLKRPFFGLFRDMLGDVFSFDGRLWRTIPALMFRPGHITKSYIDGKRMRYVPPFRLFLIASVVFFLVAFAITGRQGWMQGDDLSIDGIGSGAANVMIDGKPASSYEGFDEIFDEEGNYSAEGAVAFLDRLIADGVLEEEDRDSTLLLNRLGALSGESLSRTELLSVVQTWVPRLSFLMLPFYVLTLLMMHFWIRRIYIFDHVIVALHMQSFFYLFATIGLLLPMVHPGIVWGVFGVSTFVYPFLMMGKAYGTNWFLNLFRTVGLLVATIFALTLLFILVAFFTATDLGIMSGEDWGEAISESFGGFSDGVEDGLADGD